MTFAPSIEANDAWLEFCWKWITSKLAKAHGPDAGLHLGAIFGSIRKSSPSRDRKRSQGRCAMKHNAECRAESLLISRCVCGEHVAWKELFERYDGTLVRAILRSLGARADDLELVDRLIQDVHVRLLVNEQILTRFDPARGTLQAYLAGVAARTTKRHVQSDRRD